MKITLPAIRIKIKKDGSVISENEGQTITIKNLSNETIEIEEVSKIITRE